jgi:serine/threonine-protein kinase
MATVFLARSAASKELPLVAVKRPHRHLASDKGFLAMLVDEARLASRIQHPNVVRVRELSFEGGEPFIVLDYVEGPSLSDLRKELSAHELVLSSRVALRIVLDALAGLAAAHEWKDDAGKPLGIIHRDISPHNVLVGSDGVGKLTDFGIAKAEDRVQVTRTHEVKGKLAYLAPERVDRRRICTVQSDVFAMAVVLWECLAGRRLFRGEEAVDILDAVVRGPIPKLRRLGAPIPVELDEVIARGLSRDLGQRWKTARELSVALEHAATPAGIASHEEVARVVEAVFGPRLQVRYEALRRSLEPGAVEKLLERAGLRPRQPLAAGSPLVDPSAMAAVSSPAPTARYTFGALETPEPTPKAKRGRAWIAGGIAVGVGLLGGVVLLANRPAGGTAAVPSPSAAPLGAVAAPATRKVTVRLPFPASRVSLDGVAIDLEPPSDVVVFDLGPTAPPRHALVAQSEDGALVHGAVHEEDGEVVADEGGLVVELPDAGTLSQAPGTRHRPGPRVVRTRDGFTKVR